MKEFVVTHYDIRKQIYTTFCDLESHRIISQFRDSKAKKETQKLPDIRQHLIQPKIRKAKSNRKENLSLSSKKKIKVNIAKNLTSKPTTSEIRPVVRVNKLISKKSLPCLPKEETMFIVPNKKKKISFKKSLQNWESFQHLTVPNENEDKINSYKRKSKTENVGEEDLPDTIEDIDVVKRITTGSRQPNSFNIFHESASFDLSNSQLGSFINTGKANVRTFQLSFEHPIWKT